MFVQHMDWETRARCDNNIETFDVLNYFEHNGVYYFFAHLKTKPIMKVISGKEMFVVKAIKKLPNGQILEVFKSFKSDKFPNDEKKSLMTVCKGGNLYTEKHDSDGNIRTRCSGYILINPKVKIGLNIIKPIVISYYRKNYNTMFKELATYIDSGKGVWDENVKVF